MKNIFATNCESEKIQETMQKELIYKYEKRRKTKTKSKYNDSIYNQKHIRSQLKKIEYSEKKRS